MGAKSPTWSGCKPASTPSRSPTASSSSQLTRRLKAHIPFASSFGKENFTRVLTKHQDFELPDISGEKPELMTPTLLFLLALNSNKVLNQKKYEKLFSSAMHGYSFHKLVSEVKGYCAPLVFLVKNRYNTMEKWGD